MSLFIAWPWLALIPAVTFLSLYPSSRRKRVAAAGLFWGAYAVYEYGMQQRWLCSGECNIRVDLLLLYPALAVISVAAMATVIRARRAKTR